MPELIRFKAMLLSKKGNRCRFSRAVMKKTEFTESEALSIWCISQLLNYCACWSLTEGIYALIGIKIDSGACSPAAWHSLSCYPESVSKEFLSLVKCVGSCGDPQKYMSLFHGDWRHTSIDTLTTFTVAQLADVLDYVFATDGTRREHHLLEIAKMEELQHFKIPELLQCLHRKGQSHVVTELCRHGSHRNATPPRSSTSPAGSIKSGYSPLVEDEIPVMKDIPGMSDRTKTRFTLTEEEAIRIEKEEQSKAQPPSLLDSYMRATTLTFLSESGVLSLLNRYNSDWEREVAEMSENERHGTMTYMCTTMILEQLQGESYDKERVQIVWPARKCAVQTITDSIARRLCMEQTATTTIVETYRMIKTLYNKAISEGKVLSEIHGGEIITEPDENEPPGESAGQNPPVPGTTKTGQSSQVPEKLYRTRPPYKKGFSIAQVGDHFVYHKE
uniref:Uncharacterized protein n=1 Tax=Culex mononega-like virus 2 TaxID=2010272 RepID=A0A5Q0TW08_9MONO|nr:hypothetical protein [Culex mononega-like virus 2]QGA87312.1 hypothetical protein [Culex mononega-like virus 2]